jgi:hypothetical protein
MSDSAELATANIEVSYLPATINADFDALDRRVSELVEGYGEWRVDLTDPDELAQAKRSRAYLNGIVKDLDERRKAIKRAYMQPYEAFEARVKTITAKAQAASDSIKVQLDDAEAVRKKAVRAGLEKAYAEFAPLLVPVVPYDRLHDPKWENKTCSPAKAREELEAKVCKVSHDCEALKAQDFGPHRDLAEREFFRTLDLGAALAEVQKARAEDERIAALRAEVAEVTEEHAPEAPQKELATSQMPQPAPAPQWQPGPMPVKEPWVILVRAATQEQMRRVATALGECGVSGSIKRGTLDQVFRGASNGR